MPILLDSYSESNKNSSNRIFTSVPRQSESFSVPTTCVLDSAKAYLAKVGSPGTSIIAQIFAHSGTFGTSSVPTGAALATSDTNDPGTLPASPSFALMTFNFSGGNRITLTAGTNYCLVLLKDSGTWADGDDVVWGCQNGGSPTADGNYAEYNGSTWTAFSTIDTCYYVYGSGVPTTNSLKFYRRTRFPGSITGV